MLSNHKIRCTVLFFITLAGIVSMMVTGPIIQDQRYHLFADGREMLGISNFRNVMSNLPFLIVGALGMLFTIQKNKENNIRLWLNSFVFFIGIFFTGVGSAYYHLHPSDKTLVWDRLPMTISFMAFFSVIIGKFICARSGARALIPLIVAGLMSIIHWQMTESRGEGDLRFYALVQFLPIILIPVILLIFKSNQHLKKYFWAMLVAYLFAKVFEANDGLVYEALGFISGHTIKHIIAALAPAIYMLVLVKVDKKPLCEQKVLFSKGH